MPRELPPDWGIERGMREEYRFRPKRQPDYASVLHNLLTVPTPAMIAAKDTEDRSCIVCTENFNQGPNNTLPMNAVVLPCPSVHLCCNECTLQICQVRGPDTASCPQCGNLGRFFTGANQVRLLKYGVDSNNDFRLDVRFQQWEEIQRSFADLDKYLTDCDEFDDNGQEIRLFDTPFAYRIPDMFLDIWIDMIEADASYPEHGDHDPVLFSEFELVIRTISLSMLRNRNASSNIKDFYIALKRDIDDEFLRQLVGQGGNYPFRNTTDVP